MFDKIVDVVWFGGVQILDYFHQQRKFLLRDDHIIFKFEESMEFGPAEDMLIDQLSIQMGFPRASETKARYFT
jgi:hypothetical protein